MFGVLAEYRGTYAIVIPVAIILGLLLQLILDKTMGVSDDEEKNRMNYVKTIIIVGLISAGLVYINKLKPLMKDITYSKDPPF